MEVIHAVVLLLSRELHMSATNFKTNSWRPTAGMFRRLDVTVSSGMHISLDVNEFNL